MTCPRCRKETRMSIMSMFNTEEICMECKDIEERDPRYEEARAADEAAIRAGNYNFPGIGWRKR